jgi:hypothetical protein
MNLIEQFEGLITSPKPDPVGLDNLRNSVARMSFGVAKPFQNVDVCAQAQSWSEKRILISVKNGGLGGRQG